MTEPIKLNKLETRKVNDLNDHIQIYADDKSAVDGASHYYQICLSIEGKPDLITEIQFQNGAINETGFNGITNESLLEVVIDRMRGFQSGKFACRENALALTHLEEAMNWLLYRTSRRVAQGVEGTREGN